MIDINNESPTEKGEASELGLPTPKGASVAKVGAKIENKSECVKRLGELFAKIASFSCSFAVFALYNQQNRQ